MLSRGAVQQGPRVPSARISLCLLPSLIKRREINCQILSKKKRKREKKDRRKRGFVSSLGYIFIASRYCNICADYQINQQIAEPIK